MGEYEFNKSVGKRIRKLRRDRDMSQETLASIIGAHRPSVTLVESGDRRLSLYEASLIAKAFNVSVGFIIGENND